MNRSPLAQVCRFSLFLSITYCYFLFQYQTYSEFYFQTTSINYLFDNFLDLNHIFMSEEAPKAPEQPLPPPQETKDNPPTNNPPKEVEQNKKPPYTGYKLFDKLQIETKKNLRQRIHKAILSREITQALFGRRRFKRIDLTCTLNNFYPTLTLASLFHRKVAGLYLIVQLEKVQYKEFVDEKDTVGEDKDHSIFRLTLTRYPTQNDRNSVGFNQAYKAEDIKDPITGRLSKFSERKSKRRNQNRKNQPRERNNRQHEPKQKRPYQRRQREETKKRDRQEDKQKKNDNSKNQRQRNEGSKQQPRAKREKDQYYDKTNRRQYRGRQDQRSYRREDQRSYKREDQRTYRREEQRSYRKEDNSSSYKLKDDKRQPYKEKDSKNYQEKSRTQKQDESRYVEKKPNEENNYKRGETKNRGTGRIAPHNYQQSHIRTENRGARGPRKNRYSDDEDY